jgi:hypothetical protein
MKAFMRSGLRGLSCSDHQLHATRPGRIHDGARAGPGGLRSLTSVDSTMAAGVAPAITTRHGVAQGSGLEGATSPVFMPSTASGKRIR